MPEQELKAKGFELFVTRERLQQNLDAVNGQIQKLLNELEVIAQHKKDKAVKAEEKKKAEK